MSADVGHQLKGLWLGLFACGLVAAGVTAFPLDYETRLAVALLHGPGRWVAAGFPALAAWLELAHRGLAASYARYPFLGYGTDWLGPSGVSSKKAEHGDRRAHRGHEVVSGTCAESAVYAIAHIKVGHSP